MMIFFIFENFARNRKKKMVFAQCGPLGSFLLNSHMFSLVFIQKSEFLYYSIHRVRI